MIQVVPVLSAIVLLVMMGGCATAPSPGEPLPSELGRELPSYRPPTEAAATASPLGEQGNPPGALTLRQALEWALADNPGLKASGWGIRSAEARWHQSQLLPNPELEAEVEEFAGSGALSGFDAAQYTVALSQEILLGGKRGKAIRAAALERELAGWDYESKRLDTITAVRQAFADVLAAQQRVALSEELVRLAREIRDSTKLRVKAGAASSVENLKAAVELSALSIESDKARQSLEAARKALSATWGSSSPKFSSAAGSLEELSPLTPEALLRGHLKQNPDLARWAAELKLREAILDQEKAARVPNVTAGGGVRWLEESGDQALVAGVGVPLPLFDRNQGAIREAAYEAARAGEEARAAEAAVLSELASAYQELSSAHREASALNDELLPLAEASFEQTRQGYQQGRFGYLDVLDAQRTLFEARGQRLEALAQYQKARAAVERLIGAPLDSLSSVTEQEEK
jgi:outer membrane protein, heavy metal efflux system